MKNIVKITALLLATSFTQQSYAAEAVQLKCYQASVENGSSAVTNTQDLEPFRSDSDSFKLQSALSNTSISKNPTKSETFGGQSYWYVEMTSRVPNTTYVLTQGAWVNTNGKNGSIIGRLASEDASAIQFIACGVEVK